MLAEGTSQAGNELKTFVHLGFNEDESGRTVIEGMNDYIAARQTPTNFRFAFPGGAGTLTEPGSEPVLWWEDYTDVQRGRPTAGMLDRCRATNTCPKILETFGATEFWDLRMSPGLIGTRADVDIPLPPNVRRYYFPGTAHGGGADPLEGALHKEGQEPALRRQGEIAHLVQEEGPAVRHRRAQREPRRRPIRRSGQCQRRGDTADIQPCARTHLDVEAQVVTAERTRRAADEMHGEAHAVRRPGPAQQQRRLAAQR